MKLLEAIVPGGPRMHAQRLEHQLGRAGAGLIDSSLEDLAQGCRTLDSELYGVRHVVPHLASKPLFCSIGHDTAQNILTGKGELHDRP